MKESIKLQQIIVVQSTEMQKKIILAGKCTISIKVRFEDLQRRLGSEEKISKNVYFKFLRLTQQFICQKVLFLY